MKKQWDVQGIVRRFQANRNEQHAGPMEAYMKHHFPFLGIKSPLRKELLREQFSEYALPEPDQLFHEAWKLYDLPEREFQYAAIELLDRMKKHLTVQHLPELLRLIETKSWWDSVDTIASKLVGHAVKDDRAAGEQVMRDWSNSNNLWTIRSAILHQLKYKEQTNPDLLFKCIEQHAQSNEFFIQKAIGWALREYAKTNPQLVQTFVAGTTLRPLSKREALKHFS